ncbi:hypothetical protein CBR_g12254 [Chara braunii]|uniref:Chromo domain-containing protein n=1 Tax=Chara braunii TaxID=69332 RepID=A0A388KRL7_CHABU|nr:hypothetical protein CBR_g12254 [Chara braunii]|eukprot:GBG72686.1 hypothetical protein CBR_g12254 [Chara braunii]
MVDTRSGKSTSPYTQEQQEKMAALVRENKERKELEKQAKLKTIAEEQAAKMRKLEEEMKRVQQEEEERRKVVEEEAAAEEEKKRMRIESREESSGTKRDEDAEMEKKISEWIANLSLGEDEEAKFYVPQDERDALARELAAMEDPLERREREEEKKLEWKLRMKREKKRRDEANRLTAEVAKLKDCRQEMEAQTDMSAKMDKVLGYVELLSAAWMGERQASRSQEIALSAMRLGFRDSVRDMVTHVGGEVRRLRDSVGKFCEGAIEGAKAIAAVEGEVRPRKEPVKLKFPDAYGGKKEENFDNWEASVNNYGYLQHILTEEQVLVAFQALKDKATSFARSLARAAGCENNLVAYSKVTPLPQFFKLLRERFVDPTRGVRASDKLQTMHSRQWRSATTLKGVMDDLVAIPDHGLTEPQLVQVFYRAMPEPLRRLHSPTRGERSPLTHDRSPTPISVTLGDDKTQCFFDQTVTDLPFFLTLEPTDRPPASRRHRSSAHFDVMETEYDFILGTPWSRRFRNTEADWVTNTLVLKTKCGQTYRVPFIGTTATPRPDPPPPERSVPTPSPSIAVTSPRQFAHFIRQDDVTFFMVNVTDLLHYDPPCPDAELIPLEPDPPSISMAPISTSVPPPSVESTPSSRADVDAEELARYTTRMAARANRSRMDHPFKVGDDVLIDARHLQLEADTLRKFRRRFFGPCRILQAVGSDTASSPVSFRVKLPDYLRQARLHDVYHVSLLRPYRRPSERFAGRPYERPPPIMVDGHEEFLVSDIIGRRVTDDNPPHVEYLVRWKGYRDEEATWEPLEHLQHARMLVLEKLRESNFKINSKKCKWAKTQVVYLGHVLDGDGIKPEDSKIAAIRDWPTPDTLTELQSFLGLANYYRQFVRNFSTIAAPLRKLLKKEAIWQWDKDCTSALKRLKRALIEYPVLKVADPSLPFVITMDASQYGIGTVLQQDDGNGYRPAEFMSARMPSKKVATSTFKRELYALRQALEHWKHYLLGRHFKVYSDHETLRWLKTQAKMTPKLTRRAAEIDQYDFELKPVKGKYNVQEAAQAERQRLANEAAAQAQQTAEADAAARDRRNAASTKSLTQHESQWTTLLEGMFFVPTEAQAAPTQAEGERSNLATLMLSAMRGVMWNNKLLQAHLLAERQQRQQHQQEMAALTAAVRDTAMQQQHQQQLLNSTLARINDIEAKTSAAPGCTTDATKQLNKLNKISSTVAAMKTSITKLQTRPDAATKNYKMPHFDISKFDDYNKSDALTWWQRFLTEVACRTVPADDMMKALYLQLIGGVQAWMNHLAATNKCTIAELHTHIPWKEFEKLWFTWFMVRNVVKAAMNEVYTCSQGNMPTRDWTTKWQKKVTTPSFDLSFTNQRSEFFSRSCVGLRTALGNEYDYASFQAILDRVNLVIQTDDKAANERQSQPHYVAKPGYQRPTHNNVVISDETVDLHAAAASSTDGGIVAALPPKRPKRVRKNKATQETASTGTGQQPWTAYKITKEIYDLRQRELKSRVTWDRLRALVRRKESAEVIVEAAKALVNQE